ncbi:MAG: hypothetical protein ACREMF_03010 [Gemmatimonadales bacterium]
MTTLAANAVLLVVDVQKGFDGYNESLHRTNPGLAANVARRLHRNDARGGPSGCGRLFPAQLLHDVALADLHGEFATVLDTHDVLARLGT